LETPTLHIVSLYRRVAASVAGIFDDVIDEGIFGGPILLLAISILRSSRPKTAKISGTAKMHFRFLQHPLHTTTTMTFYSFYSVKIHRAEL
jgi:hypothetical protein